MVGGEGGRARDRRSGGEGRGKSGRGERKRGGEGVEGGLRKREKERVVGRRRAG